MKYYPVFLDLEGKKCLVVGGGPVGARKAAMLLKCGARVTAVSIEFGSAFQAVSPKGVTRHTRAYEKADLEGMFLVFAATGDRAVNARIQSDARKCSLLCNVADDPANSSFILPAVIHRGDLMIAVSTCGASPAVAKMIRKDLDRQFGPHYAELLTLMRAVRERLLAADDDSGAHRQLFHCLLENGILRAIETGDIKKTDQILADVLGKDVTCETLLAPDIKTRSDE